MGTKWAVTVAGSIGNANTKITQLQYSIIALRNNANNHTFQRTNPAITTINIPISGII